VQIEYALNAVAQGKTTLGIKGKKGYLISLYYHIIFVPLHLHLRLCVHVMLTPTLMYSVIGDGIGAAVDGVVLASEKKVHSVLVDSKSVEKIANLTYVEIFSIYVEMCYILSY
jgi:hypothetical protein